MKRNNLLSALSDMLFPPGCICCGELTGGAPFCKNCQPVEIITVKVCDKCGLTSGECDCKNNAFHFDKTVSPCYNTGIAQKAVYRMKFTGNSFAADYFADIMCQRISEKCDGISFDCVCAVPMSRYGVIKRGYNQSAMLAKRIAKTLGIPYINGGIIQSGKKKSQHKLKYKERFENVSRIYTCRKRFDGMTVLLVDDIRTTGATLNECARVLKRRGANCVIAATACITQNYIEKTYKK